MKTYRVYVTETVYHTYEIDVPEDVPEEDVPMYFYNATNEQQRLIYTESLDWSVDQVQEWKIGE